MPFFYLQQTEMINQIVTESDKMRIIDYECRICLGEFLGRSMFHESKRVSYIPLRNAKEQPSYFATWDNCAQTWKLSDSNYNSCGTFPQKSSMTRWVRKRIA